jgi:Fe-S oxidoreductase
MDEIASISARTWLLDEFLLRSDSFFDLRVGKMVQGFGRENESIKFQPHCHQRAEGLADDGLPSGTNATMELLRLCGYDVEVLDNGCCGMAGTFGYEAEHFELSMKVGELKLFPALRETTAKIVSTGAACRMQIEQGVGKDVIHPILLVAQTLKVG